MGGELSKHESQTDAAKGFGGKYGVQKDRQDEVCVCADCYTTCILPIHHLCGLQLAALLKFM